MAVIEKIENFKIEVEERRVLRLIVYKKPLAETKPSIQQLIKEGKKRDGFSPPASLYLNHNRL